MRKPWYRSKIAKQEPQAMVCQKVYLSKETVNLLEKTARETKKPISRLISIAIDNELDTGNPFNYPCEIPKTPYQEYEYADEANRMLQFILNFGHGIETELLVLCRRAYGILDRSVVMEGLRELFERDMVEYREIIATGQIRIKAKDALIKQHRARAVYVKEKDRGTDDNT